MKSYSQGCSIAMRSCLFMLRAGSDDVVRWTQALSRRGSRYNLGRWLQRFVSGPQ